MTDLVIPEGLNISVPAEALKNPEVRSMIEDAIRSLDNNQLQKFWPHTKQEAFMSSSAKSKVFMGGTRSGKSSAGVLYLLIQICDEGMIPDHLRRFKRWEPPINVRVVTPDFQSTLGSVLETLKKWTPESQLRGGAWEKAFRDKDHKLYFANGSMIDFLTLEQDVNKFGGVTRHIILYDEEPKGEKGEEIRWQGATRLAEVDGEELFTYSPIHGLGWTHDDFEENKGPEVAKDVWLEPSSDDYPNGLIVVRSSIHDNPHISKEGIRAALAKIPESVRASYELGNYTHFKGLVYADFDPGLHIRDEKEIDRETIIPLLQVDGIDPGQQTTAVLFAGFDKEGRLGFYDEHKASGVSAIPENAAERIFDIRERWGLPREPKYRIIDPSAWTRELATGKRIDAAWREAGMKVIPAQNDVEAGVFEIMRRFSHKNEDGEAEPLIWISSRCVNLIREIGKYRLEPKADGSFGVVKKDDHFVDVMRYIGMTQQIAKERRSKRLSSRKDRWIPGTAPALPDRKRKAHSIIGKYS